MYHVEFDLKFVYLIKFFRTFKRNKKNVKCKKKNHILRFLYCGEKKNDIMSDFIYFLLIYMFSFLFLKTNKNNLYLFS